MSPRTLLRPAASCAGGFCDNSALSVVRPGYSLSTVYGTPKGYIDNQEDFVLLLPGIVRHHGACLREPRARLAHREGADRATLSSGRLYLRTGTVTSMSRLARTGTRLLVAHTILSVLRPAGSWRRRGVHYSYAGEAAYRMFNIISRSYYVAKITNRDWLVRFKMRNGTSFSTTRPKLSVSLLEQTVQFTVLNRGHRYLT